MRWERLTQQQVRLTSGQSFADVKSERRANRSVLDDAYARRWAMAGPPKETRWKEGQSGNMGPKKRRIRASCWRWSEIIDRLFRESGRDRCKPSRP